MLHEGDTFGKNGSFGATEKKLNITFCKTKIKFYLNLDLKW